MIRQDAKVTDKGIWTKRFIIAAIVQGAIVAAFTVFLVLSPASILKPEISRVIAGGGAGTWFTFGYIMYIIVGVIGVAVSALFYHYLEVIMGKRFRKSANVLGWIHITLMNVGTAGAMGMMMYAGYLGGAAMLPTSVGGMGFDAAQAHKILAPFVEPISAAILVLAIGVIGGGIGFLMTFRNGNKSATSELRQERE